MQYARKIPCTVRAYSQYSRSAAKCQPFLRKKGGVQPHLFFQKRSGAIAAVARGRGGGINQTKKKGKRRKEAQHHESPSRTAQKPKPRRNHTKRKFCKQRRKIARPERTMCARFFEYSLIEGVADGREPVRLPSIIQNFHFV